MRSPEEFDDLYKDVRDRLLVEAYVLTGDQHVSRTAVRDAFTVAWHHWSKVRGVSDREAWLRPLVWKRAQHRHAARPWHKEKDLDEASAATLEALGTLSMNQRKALVLDPPRPAPGGRPGPGIGLPPAGADRGPDRHRRLRPGPRGLAGVGAGAPAALGEVVAGKRWPRSSMLAGPAPRARAATPWSGWSQRTAAVVLSGMVVAQGETPDATLSDQGFERRATKVEAVPEEPVLDEAAKLLEPAQVRRVAPA